MTPGWSWERLHLPGPKAAHSASCHSCSIFMSSPSGPTAGMHLMGPPSSQQLPPRRHAVLCLLPAVAGLRSSEGGMGATSRFTEARAQAAAAVAGWLSGAAAASGSHSLTCRRRLTAHPSLMTSLLATCLFVVAAGTGVRRSMGIPASAAAFPTPPAAPALALPTTTGTRPAGEREGCRLASPPNRCWCRCWFLAAAAHAPS